MLLVAFNLRAAIAAVGPVVPEIRADLAISGWEAGMLTTLPLLCFAVVAPAAAWLGRRLGTDRAILLACVLIAVGTGSRVLGGPGLLLAATLLVGAAMTVGNVLMPVVIKRSFAARAGTVTGLFTAAMIAGATAAAAVTAPVAGLAGWRTALGAWALLAVMAALVWQLGLPRSSPAGATPEVAASATVATGVWRSPVAWALALFLGSQAAAYYSATTWLPTFLASRVGLSIELAGIGMAVFQVLGIGGTFLISAFVRVRPRQGWLAILMAVGWAVMLVGLLWWPGAWLAWTVIGGVAQGAGIALALTLVVLRAHDSVVARGLSAMAQFVGYLVGASGPVLVGAAYEWTGAWTVPWLLLIAMAVGMAVTGAVAGRPTTVGGPAPTHRD